MSSVHTVEPEITVLADLWIICTPVKILLHDLMYCIVKSLHSSFNCRLLVGVGDRRHSVLFRSIVEIHLADFLPGSLFYEIGIDI